MKTLSLKTKVSPDYKLEIQLPNDFPTGEVEILLVVDSSNKLPKKGMTGKDLLKSPLLGIWKDRKDIQDSITFARKLRKQAGRRNNNAN